MKESKKHFCVISTGKNACGTTSQNTTCIIGWVTCRKCKRELAKVGNAQEK